MKGTIARAALNIIGAGLVLAAIGLAIASAIVSPRDQSHYTGAVLACIITYMGIDFLERRWQRNRQLRNISVELNELKDRVAAYKRQKLADD